MVGPEWWHLGGQRDEPLPPQTKRRTEDDDEKASNEDGGPNPIRMRASWWPLQPNDAGDPWTDEVDESLPPIPQPMEYYDEIWIWSLDEGRLATMSRKFCSNGRNPWARERIHLPPFLDSSALAHHLHRFHPSADASRLFLPLPPQWWWCCIVMWYML